MTLFPHPIPRRRPGSRRLQGQADAGQGADEAAACGEDGFEISQLQQRLWVAHFRRIPRGS